MPSQIFVPSIEAMSEILASGGDADSLNGEDSCACNGEDVSQAHNAVASTDTSTGNQHDYNGGDQYDPFPGTAAGGPSTANGYGLARRSGIMLSGLVWPWDPRAKMPWEEGFCEAAAEAYGAAAQDAWKWAGKQYDSAKEALKAAGEWLEEQWEKVTADNLLDALQLALDVAGMVPVIGAAADGINAAVSGGRGDYLGALVSAVAAIPGVGDVIAAVVKPLLLALKAGKIALKAVKSKIDDVVIGAINKLPCSGIGGKIKRGLSEWFESLKKYIDEWCFPAGTKVQTADGEKNIEEVEVGDEVWAYDEASGRWILAPVARVFRRLLVGTILVLAFAWGELEVTPEHPFYVVQGQQLEAREARGLRAGSGDAAGVWVKAGDLREGDVIHSRTGPATLLDIRKREAHEWVYNLEVRGPHTFTVGAAGLVAHNQCPPRNAHLAGGKHPVTGVPFDKNGFPDFSALSKKTVSIKQTGNRAVDEAAANKAAGYAKTPEGHTWHHHQDKQTMQLVPTDIHAKTGHSGGVAAINSGS